MSTAATAPRHLPVPASGWWPGDGGKDPFVKRAPTTVYVLLFIDQGSGGRPGQVLGWNVHGSPQLTQRFDGAQTAQVELFSAEGDTFEAAQAAALEKIRTVGFYRWLLQLPRRTVLSARRVSETVTEMAASAERRLIGSPR